MSTISRNDAQRRGDEIRAFRRELERLEQAHGPLLSHERRAEVTTYHETLLDELARSFDIDRTDRSRQLSLGLRIASLIGALALAASVFFLFYQGWGLLPTTVQVVVLAGAALGTCAVTLWLREREGAEYFAKLAAMVTLACFVLNIVMLGQIFNLTPSDTAFVPWAALAFLLAYACDLRLLLVFGILCMVAFVAARCGTWGGLYWLHFGERPENFFVPALALLLVPVWIPHDRFPSFPPVYRVSGLLTLLLPILVLASWGATSYLLIDEDLVEGGYQIAGFGLSALAVGYGIRRGWPEVVNTAAVFFVVLLYTKFYDWWWETMPKSLFFLVIGLSAILVIAVLRRLRSREGAR